MQHRFARDSHARMKRCGDGNQPAKSRNPCVRKSHTESHTKFAPRGRAPAALFLKPVSIPQHPDDRHHSRIFVPKDVAVIHKIANIWAPEIHPHRNAWVRPCTRPVGNVDGIEILAIWHWNAVDCHHQKMNLVDVELVVLQCSVLDCPILHGPLRRHNRRRVIGIEQLDAPSTVMKKLVGLFGSVGSESTSEK